MQKIFVLLGVITIMLGFGFAHTDETDKTVVKKDEHSIKEVMEQAMKGGLMRKVMGGNASIEEKMQVLDLFISLSESEAPKGDEEEWNEWTQKILTTYAKVLVDREDAGAALRTVTNCKSCHDKYK